MRFDLVDASPVTAVLAGRAPARHRSTLMSGVLPRSVPARLAAALAVVQLSLLSTLVTRQLRGAGSSNWDLGIFNNAVWSLARGHTFMTYRGMDVLGHHFNLIFYAFAPFSWLGAGTLFLCLTQSVALTLGAIPAYLIRGHGLYGWGRDMAEAERVIEGIEWMVAAELAERRFRG